VDFQEISLLLFPDDENENKQEMFALQVELSATLQRNPSESVSAHRRFSMQALVTNQNKATFLVRAKIFRKPTNSSTIILVSFHFLFDLFLTFDSAFSGFRLVLGRSIW